MSDLTDDERAELRGQYPDGDKPGAAHWQTRNRDLVLRLLDERDRLAEQSRLGWERAAEKDRAYGDALAELTALLDAHLGTPCEQVRHEQHIVSIVAERDAAIARAEAAENEVEKLVAAGKQLHEAWARADDLDNAGFRARLRLEEQLATERAARETAERERDEARGRIREALDEIRAYGCDCGQCPVCDAEAALGEE